MKTDIDTWTFLHEAIDTHLKKQREILASEAFLCRRAGERFEKENPGKQHAWFNSAEDYERKFEKLLEQWHEASKFLKAIDPFENL